ncbi:hypothetical protein B0H11DRAFT_2251483 [Mycena galericulata]|nr:hypothetical protein B0H11DRAFT_2251483 [Mycena galericulata]
MSFTRADWRLEDHEEPVLGPFNPDAILPDETLPDDEEVRKRTRIKILNGRIRRWFTYRIRRRRQRASGLDPRKDPFAVLLGQLTGLSTPTKARQAYQQLMHESYTEKIAPSIATEWEEARARRDPITIGRKEPKAGFRALVARKVFAELPEAERIALAQRAKDEAAKNKADYDAAMKAPPSNKPEDRQKCIEALPDFLAPILKGIQDYTGLQSFIVLGGPLPKYGGELKTVHVSWGRSKTATGAHFPQWAKERFGEQVLGLFTDYLRTVYSPSDCAAAALADLNKAPYTMDEADESGADDSDSDSEPNTDSEVPSDDDLVEKRAAKKRKLNGKSAQHAGTKRKRSGPAGAPTADAPVSADTITADTSPAAPPSAPVARAELTKEERAKLAKEEQQKQQWQRERVEREANIERNRLLAMRWRQEKEALLPELSVAKPKPRPRPRQRKAQDSDPQPRRHSGRLAGGGDNPGGDAGAADQEPGTAEGGLHEGAATPVEGMTPLASGGSGERSPQLSDAEGNDMDVDNHFSFDSRCRPDFDDASDRSRASSPPRTDPEDSGMEIDNIFTSRPDFDGDGDDNDGDLGDDEDYDKDRYGFLAREYENRPLPTHSERVPCFETAAPPPPHTETAPTLPPCTETAVPPPPRTETVPAQPPCNETAPAQPPRTDTASAQPPHTETAPAQLLRTETTPAQPPRTETASAQPPRTETAPAQLPRTETAPA